MTAIAGITPGNSTVVKAMLEKMGRRGAYTHVFQIGPVTLGEIWPEGKKESPDPTCVMHSPDPGHFARASWTAGKLVLERDRVGVTPLYYSNLPDGAVAFASEVKALIGLSTDINELRPGARWSNGKVDPPLPWVAGKALNEPAEIISEELRRRLEKAVRVQLNGQQAGSWLSGGLDSSVIAALLRPLVNKLVTVAAGFEGSPDLKYAKRMAVHLGAEHHERVATFDELLKLLPEVIYNLESFDALLVRSSLTHFLAAQTAADYMGDVFSGEGGDELFAGYEYLKTIKAAVLPGELIDITSRLHNTALQRVDRSAGAFALTAHVPFLDAQVVDYALRIPAGLKINNGVEKWILRQAAVDMLPEDVLNRPKAKFWEGSGVGAQLAAYADANIGDTEFVRGRLLPNGWMLHSKEEMLYYRIFHDCFGDLDNLDWMGRTKGAPVV